MEREEVQNFLDDYNLNEEDLNVLSGILEISDEDFYVIAPLILEQARKEVLNESAMRECYNQLIKTEGTIEGLRNSKDEFLQLLKDSGASQPKLEFFESLLLIIINGFEEIEGKIAPVTVYFEIVNENAKLPTYAHANDSGMDVYALDDYTIECGETIIIPIGLKCAIPDGYELQVRPKSGISSKTKLRIANTPGTIDAGYRDEIGIIVENIDTRIKDITVENGSVTSVLYGSPQYISKGQKIAQLVLCEVNKAEIKQTSDIQLFSGDRLGGFGSTTLY